VTYVSILSPIILSSHWLSSKHSHSCLPRDSTLVGQPAVQRAFKIVSGPRHPRQGIFIVTFGLVLPPPKIGLHTVTQLPILIKSPDALLADALLHQILKLFKFQIAQKFVCKLPTFVHSTFYPSYLRGNSRGAAYSTSGH